MVHTDEPTVDRNLIVLPSVDCWPPFVAIFLKALWTGAVVNARLTACSMCIFGRMWPCFPNYPRVIQNSNVSKVLSICMSMNSDYACKPLFKKWYVTPRSYRYPIPTRTTSQSMISTIILLFVAFNNTPTALEEVESALLHKWLYLLSCLAACIASLCSFQLLHYYCS